MSTKKTTWLPEMEGFRGYASLWVLIGHICILTSCKIPLLGTPSYGVDLFIILSGFLMTKNYIERKEIEPWSRKSTFIKFYIRRFFRIAPLYYLLLIIAVFFGPFFGEMRDIIGQNFSETITDTSRFNDQSFFNIFFHMSLLFGLSPSYSFRTVLPDWSIGLEFQYYLLFPFIMLLCSNGKLSIKLLIISVASTISYFIFTDFFESFHMPSFILMKLPVFISGMIVYMAHIKKSRGLLILSVIALLISYLTKFHISKIQLIIQVMMILFIYKITEKSNKNTFISIAKKILCSKFSVWLGDVSYSVYLIHLLIVTPTIGLLLKYTKFIEVDPITRLGIVILICVPLIYFLSHFSYKIIEKKGIAIGKKIIR